MNAPMHLCRFAAGGSAPRVGLLASDETLLDLSAAGVSSLASLLELPDLTGRLADLQSAASPRFPLRQVQLLSPVDAQEVWAAGVTYLRSKTARMEESGFSATAYDRVYAAERPELFFKSLPEKVAGPGQSIGVRSDSRWSVPEPELVLVVNSRGEIAGFTLGNDVSARDIEGENLLYLPQAKIYTASCSLGPVIAVGVTEAAVRSWTIHLVVRRQGGEVFRGETPIHRIRRGFAELVDWLCRGQEFPHGAALLTGTGIVPPDDFCLAEGDEVAIRVPELGTLTNPVRRIHVTG